MKTSRQLAGVCGVLLATVSIAVGQVNEPPAEQPYSPEPESAQQTQGFDPFLPPAGLVTPPECLIPGVGFYGHTRFVYSASNCFDLASACYKYCLFEDAIVLLSHAIGQDPQAHYYYLRAMAQMHAGHLQGAIESADGVLDAQSAGLTAGLDAVRERFNGPHAVDLRQLLLLRLEAAPGNG